MKSLQRNRQTDGGKARGTSVTSIEVKGLKIHNGQRQTDKHYQNNKSKSKEIITKKSIFASVEQIDRPPDRETDRHVKTNISSILSKRET